MIKIQTLDLIENIEHVVIPTIFPDGTSQCWKLPEQIIESRNTKVTWNFEHEVELIHLASLKYLLSGHKHLHIPYLPYARQDKELNNSSTFNLRIFADFLNNLNFNLITSVDVHNLITTDVLIKNFKNIEVINLIKKAKSYILTDNIVFPDVGAEKRYGFMGLGTICCSKVRDQKTGQILKHEVYQIDEVKKAKRILIVDDICDGGATFISITKMLKEINPELFIDLYVTHGIFSKGKQILYDTGIQNIYCTNSLLKNVDGFKV